MIHIYKKGIWHHKNARSLELLNQCDNISVKEWNGEQDGILFCNHLDTNAIEQHENVLLGPGIELFQGLQFFKQYHGKRKIRFNCLSKSVVNLFNVYAVNEQVSYVTIPFPVEVDKFQPALEKKKRFFLYFKSVHSSRLQFMLKYIQDHPDIFAEYEYRVFIYGQYKEDYYLDWIKQSVFGIWVGSHESQGFAFQEAMSCDCPLFVYDVDSLKDECMQDVHYTYIHKQGDYPMTSASYFDETCGMIYKKGEDIHAKFQVFQQQLSVYRPREYVVTHLTCVQFIERLQHTFPEYFQQIGS